jgi:long-subunit acyl-CoA synthetase (AMP-forming)
VHRGYRRFLTRQEAHTAWSRISSHGGNTLSGSALIVKQKNKSAVRYPAPLLRSLSKRFTILLDNFSEESEELTPILKIRRREIVKHHGGKIEFLYAE